MKLKDSPHPYAIITIFFWSLAYVLTRLSLRCFSAFSLGFLRYFVATCALLVIAVVTKMRRPKIADYKWFFFAGALGFFLYMIAFNKGCETVTASTSSVIIAIVPIMTALLARIFYREKLRCFQWIAITVGFIGVTVLTLMKGLFMINTGLFWLLLAAADLSVYNLLLRKLTKKYSALQTTTYCIIAGTILLAVFLPNSVKEVHRASVPMLLYVAALGIFSSAIAYAAWSQAFAKAQKTSTVSNYMFITPFLTSLLGFFIAHEKPDLSTFLGGAIILTGLFVFNYGDKIFRKMSRNKRK